MTTRHEGTTGEATPASALPDGGAALDRSVAGSTAAMAALTLLSRATGVARVMVAASVLGTTFLGNTYQSANTLPNLLFELLVAGALQAALIPTLVELLDAGERDEAEHVVRSVLGVSAAALAAVAAAGVVLAPQVMRLLLSGVEPRSLREAQVRLGAFLLWFFLPQVVVYAAGLVSTAVLNAQGRFALPVFAPVVNNVVVIGSYLLFWHLRDGAPPSLDLRLVEKVVLGAGTTLAVVGLCAVPVVAARRTGISLRPKFDTRHPGVRRVVRRGAWAALYVAMTQVLLVVVLVLGNRIEGGVVAYQVGFTFFLLPHALFALPVVTALFPRLARSAVASDTPAFARHVTAGMAAIAFFLLLATAALLALAGPIAAVALFANGEAGAGDVRLVVVGLAPGLVGYGTFLLLTRALYALGDARFPALVNAGVAVGGAAAMVAGFAVADPRHRLLAVAVAHSAAHVAGAGVLLAALRRRLPSGAMAGCVRPLAVSAGAATVAFAVMHVVGGLLAEVFHLGRLVVAGAAGAAVYVVLHRFAAVAVPLPVVIGGRGRG